MCRRLLPLLACLAAAVAPAAGQDKTPQTAPLRVFLVDGAELAKVKKRAAGGDKQLADAVAALRTAADKDLKAGPFSVVTNDKPRLAPSGDKHDYVSQAPYFWPDPDKKDGLPYIRKDGKVNPERNKFDAPVMGKMARAVGTLGLAYCVTGEEKYAEHAARLLRVWFLDAETRMNPNLNYGQFIPGVTEGRGIGIIDSVPLTRLVDAIGMLEGSRHWARADQAGMETWFRDYLQWLRTSKNGKEEAAATNNHGTWYDAQVGCFALFVGDKEGVEKLLEEAKTKRIAKQVEPDGKQPRELQRTKAWDYSRGNLEALFALATLGDRVGVDLWHFETKDGRSIRKALEYLIPYATGEKKWEYEQITGFKGEALAPLLRRAARAYQEERYERLVEKMGRGLGTTTLLYPAGK